MTWTYDPEDIPEQKHRDAIRNELPPGAMRSEPTSDAERRDMYAFGDPMLRYHIDQTSAQQDALAKHRRETADELRRSLMDTGYHDINEAAQHAHILDPAGPGDHLINPAPTDLSSLDDGEEHEEEDQPFYRVWHENGDYLGGSADPYRARQIMGGHILNHVAEEPDCPGCGVMTAPADHGFSIDPVNGADDMVNLSPKFARVVGAVSRASDTVWR